MPIFNNGYSTNGDLTLLGPGIFFALETPQRVKMDLNKKSFPETGTTAALKGIPKRSRISVGGNPPQSKSKYDDYKQIPLKSLKNV